MGPFFMEWPSGSRWRAKRAAMRGTQPREWLNACAQTESATGIPAEAAAADRGFSVDDQAISRSEGLEGDARILRRRRDNEARGDEVQAQRRACEIGSVVCLPWGRV